LVVKKKIKTLLKNKQKMKKQTILLLGFLLLSLTGYGQLKINEYSASNYNLITDFQNDREDYVEIFNSGATAINLFGYYFSDDNTDLNKYIVNKNINVPANGRIMVYFSDKDTVTTTQIHTSFKLTQCHGEQIILTDPNGTSVIDSLTVELTQKNHSRGRIPDGGATWKIFSVPTPNASNTGGFDTYAAKPQFSIAAGYFTVAQSLVLSTPEPNITIRYTTNGTAPNATSTPYTAPILFAATTVVRAKAYSSDPNVLPSFNENNTYFINVNHNFPVISVSGDFPGLFATKQQRDFSMEFFDASKNFKWDYEGFVRGHGNDSWAFQQKGIRVYCEDGYGYRNEMPEKFFENTTQDSFQVIIVKAAGSDNYPFHGNIKSAHMRDAWCQTYSIKNNLNVDERSYAPAILFVNGQYWGVYETRERVDADYTNYNFNQPKKKVDMLAFWGGLVIEEGDDQGWIDLFNYITTNSMAINANYNVVDSQLNVLSLIDYAVLNTVMVNSDMINWNTRWWRGRKGNGEKWRYTLWDQDNILGLGQNFTGLSSTDPDVDPCNATQVFSNSNNPNTGSNRILKELMKNANFQTIYKNRYTYLMTEVFVCDSMIAHINKFEALLAPEMPAQITRWGGNFNTWKDNVDSLRSFLLTRCKTIGGNTDTCLKVKQLKINVAPIIGGTVLLNNVTVPYYPKTHVLSQDSSYQLIAVPAVGYEFVEWRKFEAANTITPNNLKSDTILYRLNKTDSIVAIFQLDLPDTFKLVINAIQPYAGTIDFNGTVISTFPTTVNVIEFQNYTLKANADNRHFFINWIQNNGLNNAITPNLDSNSISIAIRKKDSLTAIFDTLLVVDRNVFIPNIFSPNGDNKNEYFGINSTQSVFIKDAKVSVYDRYGTKVYDGPAKNTGWNGKFQNQDMSMDTYYFIMRVIYTDNSFKEFKGDLMLVR
jgi:gliding motility-associated-like protein